MRRIFLLFCFLVVAIINVSFAFTEVVSSEKNEKIIIMGDIAGALVSGGYLVPRVRIVSQQKLIGFGGEAISFYGINQKDFYLLVMGLIKLGWFHLGMGGSVMARVPQLSKEQSDIWASNLGKIYPAVSLGINVPIWKIGPGKLGLNSSLDAFFSAFPVKENVQNIGEAILIPFVFTLLNMVKLTAGISYTIDF